MKALVIGGARSGIGVAKLLNSKGYEVTMATNSDFKEKKELEDLGILVVLNDRDMSLVKDYDWVVKNPGIPNDHPLVSKFSNVVNEIEVASYFAPEYKFYAISGTNGKTTATSILHDMLMKKNESALLAGNIGLALSEQVYKDGNFKRDVALEIAAFQMEGTPSFSPEIYGLINLTPDHLDRFKDENEYYQAKLKILPNVKLFVRNIDDENIVSLTQNYQGEVIDVSLSNQNSDVKRNGNGIYYNDIKLFDTNDLKLVGQHNVLNASIAAIMALKAGVSLDAIQSSISSFKPVEHRIEFIREIDGVRYYNDSKATNPESTDVALQAFDKPVHLLAGGYDKHISFDLLKKHADSLASIHVFGESAQQIMEVFPNAVNVKTMKDALILASKKAKSGEIVLLSPACASYDQFENFEQRGNIFKEFVNKLDHK